MSGALDRQIQRHVENPHLMIPLIEEEKFNLSLDRQLCGWILQELSGNPEVLGYN